MRIDDTKKVLVVEDNPDSRYLATLLLEAEGFTVAPAANGEEALAGLQADRFAFVLLDLQLPDMDGFEIARRMRQRFTSQELPIIAVSAMAMPQDRRAAFAAGCTGYIEKPIDADVFTAQVRCLAGMGAPEPDRTGGTSMNLNQPAVEPSKLPPEAGAPGGRNTAAAA